MSERRPTEERRPQIAEAALKIIGEKGLRNFTTAQLAREVGITDGTIFRHFKNKQEIVMLALERMQEVLQGGPVPTHPDPLRRLEQFFKGRLANVLGHPGIQTLVFSEQLAHAAGPRGARRVESMRAQSRAFIQGCLEEAAAQGLLRAGLEPEILAILVLGAVQSLVFLTREQPASTQAAKLIGRVWGTIERLIRG